MPKLKVLARNYKIYIEDPQTADTFQQIGGIESLTLSFDAEDVETTDFDTDGYQTHLIASRSQEIELEGSYIIDPSTGDRDAGQQLVEDLAEKVGHESLGKFRVMNPAGKVTEFLASVTLGDQGGGVKDKASWGATLRVSGKPIKIADTDTAIYNGVS